jgi:hypothetical protein
MAGKELKRKLEDIGESAVSFLRSPSERDSIRRATTESRRMEDAKEAREQRAKVLKESDAGALENQKQYGMKKGGTASSRADGIAQRGKTRGKMY